MVLLTAFAVVATLTLLFILFSKWRYQYWTRRGVTQVEPQLIFGNYERVFRGHWSIQDHFMTIYKRGRAEGLKYIGLYNILNPEWMPLDLEIVKGILTRDFSYFPNRGVYLHKSEPLSMHLFSLKGEEWRNLRTKMTPTFTSGKMKMMFETLTEKAEVLKEVVNKCAVSDKEIQIKETLARFSTDIIGSVAFGIECDSLREPDNKFREIGRKTFEPSVVRLFAEIVVPSKLLGLLGYKSIPRDVTSYFTEVVKDTINYREKNNVQRKDFMHLMLQLKDRGSVDSDSKGKGANFLTEQEIISEAFVFYLAGFETSSSASTFAIMELSQNQVIQDKLRQEIHDVLKQHDGKLTYDAVMEMQYLDKVVRETLRKYPAGAFLPRECDKTYKVPGSDLVIEKGTRVHIPVWGFHKDPEYYPNPEEFNPENFSAENKSKRPDFAWMPFGEGPRICIGLRFGMLQSKISLITLLKDFKFSPHEKTKWPLELDTGSFIMVCKGETWLTITKI